MSGSVNIHALAEIARPAALAIILMLCTGVLSACDGGEDRSSRVLSASDGGQDRTSGVLSASASGPDRCPRILLVTVDTLRADHTGPLGYEPKTTPMLDALARRGATFTRCVSQHPETGPSLSSLHTSRYPRETGVRENGDVLSSEYATLAEVFRDAGYRTAAFVSTYLLKPHASGLERGFGVYDAEMNARSTMAKVEFERRAEDTVAAATKWLRSVDDEPWFLWVHLYDPHGPYDPGVELETRFFLDRGREPLDPSRIVRYQRFGDNRDPDDYVARYDGEIFRADRAIGRLLDVAGKGTLVAFTADHGEGLGEHDYWFRHGSLLDRAALHVPLVLAGPGVPEGRRVDRLVRNLDVAPTLLELAGLAPFDEVRGASLVPLLGEPGLGGEDSDGGPIAFSEARRMSGVEDPTGIDTRYKVSATTATHRLVLWPWTGELALFDLVADPDETLDVSGSQPEVAARLGAATRRWLLLGDRIEGEDPPSDVNDAMRGHGYLK